MKALQRATNLQIQSQGVVKCSRNSFVTLGKDPGNFFLCNVIQKKCLNKSFLFSQVGYKINVSISTLLQCLRQKFLGGKNSIEFSGSLSSHRQAYLCVHIGESPYDAFAESISNGTSERACHENGRDDTILSNKLLKVMLFFSSGQIR